MNNIFDVQFSRIFHVLILATPKKRGSTSNSSNSDPDSLSPNKMYDKRKSDKDKKSVDVSGMYKFCFKIRTYFEVWYSNWSFC